ncbi:hypothetical protein [Nocardia salmonicida]|uniref:hypothetical protein n=1 Tax=Nocardia salmonicida TaxID=53431 RepID=UPI0036285C77
MNETMTGLTIRIDESASESAKSASAEQTRQLYEMGLFRDDDLTVRINIIDAATPPGGLYESSHPKIARSVARSLQWATVLEVGVRWLFFDLIEDHHRGPVDAFGALARVIHGLAERSSMTADPVVDRLLQTLAAVESSTDPTTALTHRLRKFVEFSRTGNWRSRSWSEGEVTLALNAHPNTLTAEFASQLTTDPAVRTRQIVALSCTVAQYLSFDLVAYLSNSHGNRGVTPTAKLASGELKAFAAEQISAMHSRMLDAAQTMYDQLQTPQAPPSTTVASEYVEATFKLVAIADEQLRTHRSRQPSR